VALDDGALHAREGLACRVSLDLYERELAERLATLKAAHAPPADLPLLSADDWELLRWIAFGLALLGSGFFTYRWLRREARMRLAAGALVLAVFLLANVVAAGVFLVLGRFVPRHDDLLTVAGFFLVGLVAVGCALLFILGALRHLPRLTRRS